MEIQFKTGKLLKSCTDTRAMIKVHGPERAKVLRLRLDQLRAAPNLAAMKGLPGRCHELSSDMKGALAVDLDGPYRLIFKPTDDPPPRLSDGGLDWDAVTAIRVVDVRDYHG
jgi:proteic killer suppression protein